MVITTPTNMKKAALLLLFATFLLQWIVPAKMIWEQERLYETGITYKIRTVPVDPNDPFRGKYITLRYDISNYTISDVSHLEPIQVNKQIYVQLEEEGEGFAKISHLSDSPPNSKNYLIARIQRFFRETDNTYHFRLSYPFETYFMEESKALKAEQLYRDALRNSDKKTYGVVNISRGKAVLKDVQVDGISIKDLVE